MLEIFKAIYTAFLFVNFELLNFELKIKYHFILLFVLIISVVKFVTVDEIKMKYDLGSLMNIYATL